ncbi:MAG: TonB-dependent siderophore receptor, partial [Methylovulum sp.]|nr:TonB-dependent siderophore receptor [Methylovulum sp.]
YIYGGFDSFIVRGFELGQFQYRNGVRIPGLNLDLANVRQVEVLKGPASGLYGRIEPGGLINLVTKRPLEESYYSLEQRFGSFDYYRTQASATGAVNADKSLLYGVDLSYLNSGSFREHSFNDRVFFAPSLTWKPFDNTEANLTVEYLNEDRVYDSGLPATDTGILDVPITRQLDNPGLSDTHEYVLVDFNWSHQFNNAWKIQNGVVSLHSNFDENETYTWGYNPGNRTIGRYAWFGNEQTDLNTVYLNLTGKFDTYGVKHSILAGADYFNQQSLGYGTDNFVDAVNVDHPVYVSNQSLFAQYGNLPLEYFRDRQGGWYNDQENSWYGLYFQDQMAFFDDRLLIMGGGRYDWANVDKAGAYFSDLSTDALQDGQFSPRVGITVRPWQWLAVYGNYMESFGTNNGRSVTGEIFAPQAAKQYEAGIKTEFFDGRLNSTLAYYHLTKTNVVTKLDNSQFDQAVGEARSQGIEFDLSGQLTDDLNLITTYAFTDARVTKDSFAILGNRLPYVPGHSGSVWLKYAFPQAMLQGFSVGAGVYAASEREGNVTNTYRDGAYARLDLFGAYTHKLAGHKLTTQVNLYNVSDSEYYLMRNQSQNLPAEPLTVFGSVRLEY